MQRILPAAIEKNRQFFRYSSVNRLGQKQLGSLTAELSSIIGHTTDTLKKT